MPLSPPHPSKPMRPRPGHRSRTSAHRLDRHITRLLRTQAHTPQQWQAVNNDLAAYALPILRCWITEGSLPARIRRTTGQTLRLDPTLPGDPEAAGELLGLTIAVSLDIFRRRALAGTGWHPGRGTHAQTYFLRRCLMSFPREYQRFTREQRPAGTPRPLSLNRAARLPDTGPSGRPADLALARCLLSELLSPTPPARRRTPHTAPGPHTNTHAPTPALQPLSAHNAGSPASPAHP
ncbi:hypothetical protein [Streptomyces sp. MNP-20]|uniref:hypothetical protein n=1 Tax=Streptomyces sp. MNP-20 TaxID=2721165 RepID=UPI0015565471|nr:hypothetical protein [Streptomyces sp. MNP-20]